MKNLVYNTKTKSFSGEQLTEGLSRDEYTRPKTKEELVLDLDKILNGKGKFKGLGQKLTKEELQELIQATGHHTLDKKFSNYKVLDCYDDRDEFNEIDQNITWIDEDNDHYSGMKDGILYKRWREGGSWKIQRVSSTKTFSSTVGVVPRDVYKQALSEYRQYKKDHPNDLPGAGREFDKIIRRNLKYQWPRVISPSVSDDIDYHKLYELQDKDDQKYELVELDHNDHGDHAESLWWKYNY